LFYEGLLDEVKMWHAALKHDSIVFHMNNSVVYWHPNFNDTIAYYKFDRSHEFIVYDSLNMYKDPLNYAPNFQGRSAYHGRINTTDFQNVLWNNLSHVVAHYPPAPPPPSPPPPSPPPQPGPAALYFNGVNTLGEVAFDAAMAPADALTFEAWIRPSRVDRAQFISSVGNEGWGVAIMCSGPNQLKEDSGCCGGAPVQVKSSQLTHGLKASGANP
jgi:hypothetical protein